MVNQSQFIEMFGNILQDKKLAEISEIYDGVHQTPHYTDSGIKFISVEDISDIYGSKKYISIEDYSKYKHVPELGDLIMTRIGTIGLCAVVSKSEPLAYYVSVTLIKPNHNIIDSTFLKYYIESGYGQNELRMRSLLEAFPMKINLNEIGKVAVMVPSMESQLAFVQIVQRADKSKFAGFKSQFIEMFGLPSANYKAFTVGSIADVVSDVHYGTSRQSNEDGDYPYLRMNNITYEGDLDLSDLKMISVPKEELSGCLVKKGDVLFNRTNSKDLVGKTCCFSLEQPMIIAGYIIRLRMNGLVLPEYLSVFLNLPGSKIMLQDISKGAVGQANINAKEVQSISLLIPPIELQNQFVAQKNQADKSKYLN